MLFYLSLIPSFLEIMKVLNASPLGLTVPKLGAGRSNIGHQGPPA
jgi:hypothetical protein